MSSWYKTGTASFTNGNTAVVGVGTAFIANVASGEAIQAPDGRFYEIDRVSSDTGLVLAAPYLGATVSGQTYTILPSQSYLRDLANLAAELVNSFGAVVANAGAGKFGDGTLAAPGVRFSADEDTGLYRSGPNEVTFVANGVAQFKYSSTAGITFLNAVTAAIAGGSIKGTPIGQENPAAGSFTTLSATGPLSVAENVAIQVNPIYGQSANIGITLGGSDNGFVNDGGISHWRNWVSGDAGDQTLDVQAFVRGSGYVSKMLVSATGLSVTGAITTNGIKEDANGNVGIGITPSAWSTNFRAVELSAGSVNAYLTTGMQYAQNAYSNATGERIYKHDGYAAEYTQYLGQHAWKSAPLGTAGQLITFTQDMTLAGGNLLVGVSSGTCHQLRKSVAQGGLLLTVSGVAGTAPAAADTAYFYAVDEYGQNAAATAISMGRNSTTTRSFCAGGGVYANGNDYAEYEHNNGLTIAKGSIVGFKADGTLTLTFAGAIRFGIKSTDPSFTGGDTWGGEDQVGKRPEQPCYVAPTYEGLPKPGEKPVEPVLTLPSAPSRQDGEPDETFAIREAQWQETCAAATTAHQTVLAAYEEALAAWETAYAAWQDDDASYQGKVIAMQSAHEYAMARYEEALADFEVRLEAARQQVDRVAYSGKVPVNVIGATPGGYIIAVEGADGAIVGEFAADPDFAQYKRAVGRVNRILEDGRAEVAVMVH